MENVNTGAASGSANEVQAGTEPQTGAETGIVPLAPQVPIEEFKPRKIAGLTVARFLCYVMLDLQIRPLIVVDAGDGTGAVNGVLFFDASDLQNHPQALLPDASGHAPTCARFLKSVQFDENGAPGTWHWPKREPAIASSLDANAFAAMVEPVYARVGEMVREIVNAKLEATVEHVNKLLASYDAAVLDMSKRLDVALGETPDENTGADQPVGGPALVASSAPADKGTTYCKLCGLLAAGSTKDEVCGCATPEWVQGVPPNQKAASTEAGS